MRLVAVAAALAALVVPLALASPAAAAGTGVLTITMEPVDVTTGAPQTWAGMNGPVSTQLGYRISYSCSVSDCTDATIQVSPGPLDPTYNNYRHLLYGSWTAPFLGATIGGTDTTGKLVSLGNVAAGASGSFTINYQWATLGSANASTMVAAQFFPQDFPIVMSATGASSSISNAPAATAAPVQWRSTIRTPALAVSNPGSRDSGIDVTYTVTMNSGCLPTRDTAAKGDARYTCAKSYSVVDQLDPRATFVSASNGGVYDSATNTVTWTKAPAVGLGEPAAGWYAPGSSSVQVPRTVVVRYNPEDFSPTGSDVDFCDFTQSVTSQVSMHMVFLGSGGMSDDSNVRDLTATSTHNIVCVRPFAKAIFLNKLSTFDGPNRYSNGNSPIVVQPDANPNLQYWDITVANQANVAGIAVIVDPDLAIEGTKPSQIQAVNTSGVQQNDASIAWQLNDGTNGTALGTAIAPSGKWFVSMTVTSGSLAGPNLQSTGTAQTTFIARVTYAVTGNAPLNQTRTNTASASMSYPGYPALATLNLGTKTHTLQYLAPFGRGSITKATDGGGSSNVSIPASGSATHYWSIFARNTGNIPGVAVIDDAGLDGKPVKVTSLVGAATGSSAGVSVQYTLNTGATGTVTALPFTAPAGTWITAVHATTPVIAPVNALSTQNVVSSYYELRLVYSVVPSTVSGSSWTNTATGTMTYPGMGVADVPLASAASTVNFGSATPIINAQFIGAAVVEGGGQAVPGRNVTFGVRAATSNIIAGSTFTPQYVFIAPANWAITAGSASFVAGTVPAGANFVYKSVVIAGVTRQAVVATWPAGTSFGGNTTWPTMSVIAQPTALALAGSSGVASAWAGEASNNWSTSAAVYGGAVADTVDIDGDGITTEGFSTANAAAVTVGSASQLTVIKEICFPNAAAADGCDWVAQPGAVVGVNPAASNIEYRVRLINSGNTNLTSMVAYDVLPYLGDTGTSAAASGTPRGSTFQEKVNQIVTSTGVTLAYSASTNPCRAEVYPAGPTGCTNDWSTSAGAASGAQAIRMTATAAIAPGDQVLVHYKAAVIPGAPADAIACNSVAAKATQIGVPAEPLAVCATTQEADLALAVPARLPLQLNRPGILPYTVTNLGGSQSAPAIVDVDVPAGVRVNSLAPTGWSCASSTAGIDGPLTLTCTAVDGAGAARNLTKNVADPLNIPVVPTAGTSVCIDGGAHGRMSDPNLANNDATACFTVAASIPGIAVTKDDGKSNVSRGTEFTYTITATSALVSEALPGVVLTDTLPAGLEFVAASDGGAFAGGVVTWPALDLAASGIANGTGSGQTGGPASAATRTVTVRVASTAVGSITNTADATAPDPADPGASITGSGDDTDQLLMYTVTKSVNASAEGVYDGDDLTYTVVVQNLGTAALSGAQVHDDLAGVLDDAAFVAGSGQVTVTGQSPVAVANPVGGKLTWAGSLPPDASATITYRMTVGDSGDGVLSNTAFTSATGGACDPVTRLDENAAPCASTATYYAPLIAKTVSSLVQNDNGTWTIGYAIDVTNRNPVADVDYTLADSLALGAGITKTSASVVSGPSGVTLQAWSGTGAITGAVTLPAGDSHHYDLTVTADAHDLGGTAAAACTDGIPSGFSNTASLTLASGRSADTSTCAEPTEPTVAKTSTPAVQNPDGTFTLVYTVTATGPSDVPTGGLAYTLDDQFDFPAGVQVGSVAVTGPAGAPIDPAFAGAGGLLTGADRIGAGEVRVFTVTVTTDVPANSVAASGLACPPAGSGGYGNAVSLRSGTSSTVLDTASACERIISLPAPLISKSVESSSVDGASGDWTIVYGITVTNPDAQYVTSYTLTDALTFGAGITVVSAQTTSPDAAVSGTWDGKADTTLATGIPLGASAVHHYTVTVVATPPGVIDDTNAADMDCRIDPGESGSGFRNVASISSVATPAPVAEACEAATDPSVVKAAAGVPTQDPATGIWTVVYKVTVTNRSTTTVAGGVPYTVDDAFGFPAGVTVTSVHATGPGTLNSSFDGDSDTALAGGSIDAAASDTVPERHVYTVTVQFEAAGGIDIDDRTCDPAGAAGGLLNTAEIKVGVRTTAAVACADVPDAPVFGVTKTILGQQQQADGTWVVLYRVTVANPSQSVTGFYDLGDEFAVGAGITVDSASIVARPTGVTANPAFDGVGDTSISAHILLGGGASHQYTVRAVINSGSVRGSDAAGDCVLTGGETGTGFQNTASVTSGAAVRDATACVTAFDPGIAKTTNGQPAQGADGSWTVKYVITVTNPSPTAGLFYELDDQLDFPAGTAFASATVAARAGGPATSPSWDGVGDLVVVPTGTALAAGAAHVFDVTVVATLPSAQASIVGGWANGATVLSGTAGIVTTDAHAAADIALPALTVTKTTTAAGAIAIGDTVSYTVHAENTGVGAFTTTYPAEVWDDLVGVLDDAALNAAPTATTGAASVAIDKLHWTGALGAGQSADITYTVTVTAAGDLSLENVAFAGVPGTTPPTPTVCAGTGCATTQTDLPGFQLEKTVSAGVAAPGDTVDYTVTFTNTGLVNVTGATFTDDLSDVLDDTLAPTAPVASAGTATLAGGSLSWIGDLNAGDSVTVTYSVTAVSPLTGNALLVNTATSDPKYGMRWPSGVCPASAPCATPDRTVEVQTGIRSIAFTKVADAVQAVPGQKVTFTVTVTNIGKADYTSADPARVVDSMAGALDDGTYNIDAAASTGTVTYAAPQLTWAGPIAAGASVTIRYSITINPTLTGDRKLDNVIGVASTALPASSFSACLPQPTDNAQAFCLVTLAIAPLAYTGVASSTIPLLAALLTLLIGVVLVLIRRRREKTLAG